MTQSRTSFQFRGQFVGGEFKVPADPSGEWTVRSPADLSDEVLHVRYSYRAIDEAVSSARAAFSKWRKLPPQERAEYLKKYQSELKKREDHLCEAMAREVGKPLWEAKTEVTAMVGKVDVTINESMKLIADSRIPDILPGTTGLIQYRPLGVMAVIGPFNFPGHLANGHIVPSLLTGNTVIFKPTEKSPLVGQIMAECFHAAGFPAGVFNLVQGEKEVGRRLVIHEGVDGILFTGSYEVGLRIKQDTLQQHWKMLALEMGGKNSAIVWDDAPLEYSVNEVLTSAFITAGQRCSSTSRVIVHKSRVDEFTESLHEKSKAFKIAHPFENPFMGPLIDSTAVERYMKFLGIASREGCELIMRGKSLDLEYSGHYVAPSICRVDASVEQVKKSVYQQTELFAPNVVILSTDQIEEAIALANATQFGLVSSVFTESRAIFTECLDMLQCGLVNWNRGTIGASSKLPFGGFKKSGNHRPAALMSTLYCTTPIGGLEVESPLSLKATEYPGLRG